MGRLLDLGSDRLMPDSHPNDFGQSGAGDITSQYLQVATYFGIDGFPAVKANWGVANAFVNGSTQTDVTAVAHGLGMVPGFVAVCNVYGDGGRWVSQIYTLNGTPDANVFYFYAQDLVGGVHGPGNLGNIFYWLAMGPDGAS